MVQSVELLLDDDLDAAVRRQWRALADAGLASQARHPGATNAPHVTLAVADCLPADVEAALPGAVTDLPLPLRLGALTVFGRRRRCVLVRLVVPSVALLSVHADVARVAADAPGVPANLLPGAWTPHVTLARGLPVSDLPAALDALADTERPNLGAAVGARRWDGTARRVWSVSSGA